MFDIIRLTSDHTDLLSVYCFIISHKVHVHQFSAYDSVCDDLL